MLVVQNQIAVHVKCALTCQSMVDQVEKRKKCLQRKCTLTESYASPTEVHGFTLTLDQHDFNTLSHLNWLNDQVMDTILTVNHG